LREGAIVATGDGLGIVILGGDGVTIEPMSTDTTVPPVGLMLQPTSDAFDPLAVFLPWGQQFNVVTGQIESISPTGTAGDVSGLNQGANVPGDQPQSSADRVNVLANRLRRGDRNGDVRELQRLLGIPDDGIFGPQTERAVAAHGRGTVINATLGTNVNFAALSRFEGGQLLTGDIPSRNGVVLGRSGVTIATGVDIGQMDAAGVRTLGLPADLEARLLPYAGYTRNAAVQRLQEIGNLNITQEEANLLDDAIMRQHLTAAMTVWDRTRSADAQTFTDLTQAQQTVLFSRTYHQGTDMPQTPIAREFYGAAQSGDWVGAENALRGYRTTEAWYINRVTREANLLQIERLRGLPR